MLHEPPAFATMSAVLAEPTVVETRQVFDLPKLGHQVLAAQCACSRIARGTFPADVVAPVQYGPARQSKATNLLWRLCTDAEDVWRFAGDPHVPFSNKLTEQAVRMPKVKQSS